MIPVRSILMILFALALVLTLLYGIDEDMSDPSDPEYVMIWMDDCDDRFGDGQWVAVPERNPGFLEWGRDDVCVSRDDPRAGECGRSFWGCEPRVKMRNLG